MRIGIRAGRCHVKKSFEDKVNEVIKAVLDANEMEKAKGKVLVSITDKNGHKTRRWMNPEDAKKLKTEAKPKENGDGKSPAGQDKSRQAAENKKKLGVRFVNKKKAGAAPDGKPKTEVPGGKEGGRATGKKPAIGEVITGTERGTGNAITGKVTSAGKDGVTVLSNNGTTHAVEWAGVESISTKSKGFIAPAEFNAGEWKQQWDDPKATPGEKGFDYILESFGESGKEIADKIRETEEKLKGRPQTWQKYRISGEGESSRYTEEREKLHGRIMQELLRPDKLRAALSPLGEKPTFMILGGRGGSGKSWFKNNVYDPSKYVILDADEIKGMLPEFEGWNAQDVHEESSDILEQMLSACIKNGLNVVLDGTMKTASSALGKVFRMKSAGYKTEAHYMHLPRQEAAKRAIGRFRNGGKEGPNGESPEPFTGRYVPVDIILKNTTNEDSFDQVKGLVDKWSFRDNNVEKRGDPPIIISEGEKTVKKSFAALVKKLSKGYT
jgi:predicted kinase